MGVGFVGLLQKNINVSLSKQEVEWEMKQTTSITDLGGIFE